MFAGIGGFRSGLTRAGGFRCVGHCEIDKYANASYQAIYEPGKEERYYPDATQIDPADLPDFDLLCGGFPCQAFSNAGRRRGFADARGTLFFEIARLAQAKRPPYLLLENVIYVLKCINDIMSCKDSSSDTPSTKSFFLIPYQIPSIHPGYFSLCNGVR
mgnify:CR=1 FL=1